MKGWAMAGAYVLSMSIGAPAQAQFYSGNQLWEYCSEMTPGFTSGVCSGYILGVYDTIHSIISDRMVLSGVCAPEGVTAGQIRDVAIQYLKNRPEERTQQASIIILNALASEFPCRKP